MITKNKQSPATLYLLNAKNANQVEEERKSARLSFNKKKSSRSISQYQKWNPIREQNGVPFQPVTRTSSEIKKIVLSKTQFGVQSLPIEKKLSEIMSIFGNRARTQAQTIQPSKLKQNPRNSNSRETSLLSLKEESKRTARRSHIRTQSTGNPDQNCTGLETILQQISGKFNEYERHSDDWKSKYITGENDELLDEMVRTFRTIVDDLVTQFKSLITGNIEYCEKAILDVVREYENQTADLKVQLRKVGQLNSITKNLFQTLNQKHQKGVICSMVWEDIQTKNANSQEAIRMNSELFNKILSASKESFSISKDLTQFSDKLPNNENQRKVQSHKALGRSQSEDNCHQQHQDYVGDEEWNDHFQNRQCIQGVLKYIHNHNEKSKGNKGLSMKKKEQVQSSKGRERTNSDMKINNWQSVQKNDKLTTNLRKILSQR